MSKEGLLITLLKSGCSFADFRKSNSNNAETEKTIKNFNELRDKLSRSKIKKNRKKNLQNRKQWQFFYIRKRKDWTIFYWIRKKSSQI